MEEQVVEMVTPLNADGDFKMQPIVLKTEKKKHVKRPKENHNVILKADKNVIVKYDRAMKIYDLIIAIVGTISVFCTVILLEIGFSNDVYKSQGDSSQMLKFITSVCTLIILIALYKSYVEMTILDGKLYRVAPVPLHLSERFGPFLLEAFLLLIHAPPYLDFKLSHGHGTFLIDKVAVFTLIRLYRWLDVYRDFSDIYQQRRWILLTMFIKHNANLNLSGLEFTTALTFKHYFHRHPWSSFFFSTLFSIVIFVYIMYIAERDDQPENFTGASDLFYFVCVTMTTVGYGDISPVTKWGRGFSVLAGVTGITLAALLLTTLLQYMQFSPAERHASSLVLRRKYRRKVEKDTFLLKQLGYERADEGGVEWKKICVDNNNEYDDGKGEDDGSGGCCVEGVCGYGFCVNDSIRHEYNRIKLLKSRRQHLNKEKNDITIDDNINQMTLELKKLNDNIDEYGSRLAESTLSPVVPFNNMNNNLNNDNNDDSKKEQTNANSDVIALNVFKTFSEEIMDTNTSRAIMFGTKEDKVNKSIADPELLLLNADEIIQYDKALYRLNTILCALTSIAMIDTVILLENGWQGDEYIHGGPISTILKIILSTVSLLTIVVLYMYYAEEVRHDCIKYKQIGRSPPLSIWTSDRLNFFLLEVFLCILHTPPGLDIEINNSGSLLMYDKFSVAVFLRAYLFIRLYRDYSYAYKNRTTVLKEGDFRQQGSPVQFGSRFSLKHAFKMDPWMFTIVSLCISITLSSYLMYICEREGQPGIFTSFSNIIYFVCVTMTTVGYGDMSPIGGWGRTMAMMVAIVGIILAALLVASVIISLELDPNEKLASAMVTEKKFNQEIKKAAAELLQTWWHMAYYKRTGKLKGSFSKKLEGKDPKIIQSRFQYFLVQRIRTLNKISRQAMESQKDTQDLELSISKLRRNTQILSEQVSKLLGNHVIEKVN